ncbi:hypothetical protein BHM03_00003527 [Ensete ventricosum]|nr:hypothetical protein BHM03_00003527 [Ensete ventricosum]
MHQTGRPRQGPVNPARRSGGPASVGGRRRAQWSLSGEPSNEGSVSRQSDGPKKQQQRGRRDRGEAKHERNSSIPSRSTSRFLCPISRRIISTLAPVFSLIQLETRPLRVTEPPGENKRPRSRNLRSTAGLPPRGRDRFLQVGDSLTRTRVDSGVVAQAAFGVRHLCRGDVAFPHVVELEDPGLAHAGPVAVVPLRTDRLGRIRQQAGPVQPVHVTLATGNSPCLSLCRCSALCCVRRGKPSYVVFSSLGWQPCRRSGSEHRCELATSARCSIVCARDQETGSSKLDELLLALCACDLIVSRDRRRPTEEDTVRSRRCLGR